MPKSAKVESTFLLSPQWFDLLDNEKTADVIDAHFQRLLASINGWSLDVSDITEPPLEGKLSFSIGEFGETDRQRIEANNPYMAMFNEYVPLRVKSVWHSLEHIAELNRDRKVRDDLEVVRRTVANVCESIVCRILVLMNVYLPGSSRCHYIYSDNDFDMPLLGCVSSFQDACYLLVKSGISPAPTKDFREVVSWSKSIKGFWIGKPNSNVGRALNFLSHAHHRTHQLNELADITWIVGALEAILTESNQEIRAKVSRRALMICPELASLTSIRDLGRLYDFRSKFLHGGINIPNHFQFGWDPEWYGFEFSSAFALASAVLIKCFQRIATEGWAEVAYSEQVTGA